MVDPVIVGIDWNLVEKIGRSGDVDSDEPAESIICKHSRNNYCDREVQVYVSYEDVLAYAKKATKLFQETLWIPDILPYGNCGRWNSDDGLSRYEFWTVKNGSYVVMQLRDELIWIVGCLDDHPFVETNMWGFYNSDGSTECELDPSVIDLNPIIFLTTFTLEYLFDQVH